MKSAVGPTKVGFYQKLKLKRKTLNYRPFATGLQQRLARKFDFCIFKQFVTLGYSYLKYGDTS